MKEPVQRKEKQKSRSAEPGVVMHILGMAERQHLETPSRKLGQGEVALVAAEGLGNET
jgi:hypothetical protein